MLLILVNIGDLFCIIRHQLYWISIIYLYVLHLCWETALFWFFVTLCSMYFYICTENWLNLFDDLFFYWLLLMNFINYFYFPKYTWLFWNFCFCNAFTSTSLWLFKMFSFLYHIWFINFWFLLIYILWFLLSSCNIATILFY